MDMWQKMLENQILVSSVAGWVVAQVLKTIIDCTLNHDFSPERLVGAGGMPSSHSSTVCALVVSSGICCGVSSPEFAVSFVLAAVVMYDAIGVRWETGIQAKVLNEMLEMFRKMGKKMSVEEKLKEFVGQTPLQVLMGALLGIAVAVAVYL